MSKPAGKGGYARTQKVRPQYAELFEEEWGYPTRGPRKPKTEKGSERYQKRMQTKAAAGMGFVPKRMSDLFAKQRDMKYPHPASYYTPAQALECKRWTDKKGKAHVAKSPLGAARHCVGDDANSAIIAGIILNLPWKTAFAKLKKDLKEGKKPDEGKFISHIIQGGIRNYPRREQLYSEGAQARWDKIPKKFRGLGGKSMLSTKSKSEPEEEVEF